MTAWLLAPLTLPDSLPLDISSLLVFAGYVDPNSGGMLFYFLGLLFAFLSGLLLFFATHARKALSKARRFWFLITRRLISD
ncbi:MAG TPA: hypothetical protein PLP42_09950 [Acidobacteriota bacterium]|nr:hypothetical protein [Acidobacteriota bacterium]